MLPKRPLGTTGLQVTLLGFGGIPISRLSQRKASRVVKRALARGVNYFDTARAYGSSESHIGTALRSVRDQVILSTKGIRRGRKETWEDIQSSLRNLQTDYIDLYFVHDVSRDAHFDQVFASDGALAAVLEAKERGIVRHVGISGHRAPLLTRLIETGAFEVVMVPVNIADLDFQDTVIPRANELGLGVVAMKPFAGGALGNADTTLRYALTQPVTTVIPGVQSVAEVDENAAIAQDCCRPLRMEERRILEEEARSLGARFCRQCGYCLPCTVEIDIPQVLLLDRYHTRYWLRDVAQAGYCRMSVPASACIECGDCEARCPYELPIIDMLAEARSRLES